jgi:hypothetical protein
MLLSLSPIVLIVGPSLNIVTLLVPNIPVRAEPHPTESKTEYEDGFEYEYDCGTKGSGGESRAIAESGIVF